MLARAAAFGRRLLALLAPIGGAAPLAARRMIFAPHARTHQVTVISTSPHKADEATSGLGAATFLHSGNEEAMKKAKETLDGIIDTVRVWLVGLACLGDGRRPRRRLLLQLRSPPGSPSSSRGVRRFQLMHPPASALSPLAGCLVPA